MSFLRSQQGFTLGQHLFAGPGETFVITMAFALLVLAALGLEAFAFFYFDVQHWELATKWTIIGLLPLTLLGGALVASGRRFGMVESGLPGLIGAAILVGRGLDLYSVALRPFRPGLGDKFEPNLVFVFAPIHLFPVAMVLSAFVLGWSWRRSRRRSRYA